VIRDIPTRWLLLLAFLGAGLLPLMTVALVSYGTGRGELKQQSFRQLESVRNIKKAQLGRFFDERRRDVDLLSRDPYMLEAFLELEQAFRAEGGAAAGRFAGHNRRTFGAPVSYRAVHDRHFSYLARFVDQRGYYDLLLLDAVHGETCFSVEKERDFAAVVGEQPTALREVWRDVLRERREVLSDTRPYPPSENAAAQFVAAPLVRESRLVGVVALQIGLTEVDAIVGESSGMGHTGETRLIGPDFRQRSDSVRHPHQTVQAAFLDPTGHRMENEAIRRALAGEAGAGAVTEADGRRILAAWAPFESAGLHWALVAQIDESEIDAQIDRALNPKIATLLLISGVAVVLLALLLSLLISRSISSVGTQLGRLSEAVLRGELRLRVAEEDVAVDFREVVVRINDLVDAFVARLDSLPVPVLLVDRALTIQFANATACRLKGKTRSELVGHRCCSVFALGASCAEGCLVKQAIDRDEVVRAEIEGSREDASFLVTASPLLGPGGAVVGGFEVIIDQSEARRMEREKRALEKRIARMQRLEAIGTLAGGIAHDFNNILTYMFAYADIAQGMLPAGSPAAPHVEQLVRAIERAADLVGQILAFSRQANANPQMLDLGPLVKEAAKLIEASLPAEIEIRVSVPDRPFTVLANPAQIHQVILNLLTNAHQAVENSGGKIVVELNDAVCRPGDSLFEGALPVGAYRVLTVRDTGGGMDSRTMDRIFEPFFTTKPIGKGTGMGLALVHGIVTGCGGTILVESALGKGSTFHVFLPRAEGTAQTGRPCEADAPGKGRRVLFVDDDRHVCDIGRQLLESLGYVVRACSNGNEAISEIREHGSEYDAVVTDLRMPEVDGLQIAEAVRAQSSKLPVIVTTAYTDGVSPEQAQASGAAELLFKPFRKSDLARILHRLLG
jgi:signal transduction histidine kinase/CheY-like chemotaxis protein